MSQCLLLRTKAFPEYCWLFCLLIDLTCSLVFIALNRNCESIYFPLKGKGGIDIIRKINTILLKYPHINILIFIHSSSKKKMGGLHSDYEEQTMLKMSHTYKAFLKLLKVMLLWYKPDQWSRCCKWFELDYKPAAIYYCGLSKNSKIQPHFLQRQKLLTQSVLLTYCTSLGTASK